MYYNRNTLTSDYFDQILQFADKLVNDGLAFVDNCTPQQMKEERDAQVNSVNRDINDDISTTGTLDPGTLKITSEVSWFDRGGTTTKVFETYITDLYAN